MSALDTLVRHDVRADVTVVRVRGPLNLETATQIRVRLRKCVAECPTAVIVDVAECVAETPAALAVFPAVAHGQTSQPWVAIILCGANRRFLRRGGSAALARIPAFEKCGDALQAAAAVRAAQQRVEIRLPRSTSAPGIARDAIDRACESWRLGDVKRPALLIISELVTNAVRHCAGDVRLDAALRGRYLHLRVHDGSSAPPILITRAGAVPEATEMRESGRGLRIVDRYSTAWGFIVNPTRSGKVVWATIRATPLGA